MTVNMRYETAFDMDIFDFFIKNPIPDLVYKKYDHELVIMKADEQVAFIEYGHDGSLVVAILDKKYEKAIVEVARLYDKKTEETQQILISCHYLR